MRDPAPAIVRNAEGGVVRIQLLSAIGYPLWPTENVDLIQRYSDAPPHG